VDPAQDSQTTSLRKIVREDFQRLKDFRRLSAGLSKALDPVRGQVEDLRDQVEKFSEEQVERKNKREAAHAKREAERAKREAEKEASRAAAPSEQAAIDEVFRVHAETGIHPSVAAHREEFREALNGLLNPAETLVEFVDAFSVHWVFQPEVFHPDNPTSLKHSYQGTHYPVRSEVWLALTSERLRRGRWAVEVVPTGLGYREYGEAELLDKWTFGENPPAYPFPGFGYSDASLPIPAVFASETIEIEQVRRVQVTTGGHQPGSVLDTDLQATIFDGRPVFLQSSWAWVGLGMNGWYLSDPLPPLYTLSGSIGSDQFDYWSFDHRILALGRALQERKALTSTPEAGQEELPPSESAAPKAEPSPEVTVSGELGRLAELHQQGFLSDDEFAEAKKKVLDS